MGENVNLATVLMQVMTIQQLTSCIQALN